MMRLMRLTRLSVLSFILLGAAQTAGMTQTPSLPCHGAQRPKNVAELLFGRNIGNRLGVTESAFARFLDREVTPRFSDGLTTIDAVGEWRDRGNGGIVRERSKLVEIVLPGNTEDQARLDAIVAAYKRDFRQQAVGVIVRPACVSF